MTTITIAHARKIIATAFSKATEMGFKPLGVSVLDTGGHLIAFERQDGASFLRHEIGEGKAYVALAMGAGSRSVAKAAVERPHFFQGLSGVAAGRAVPVPGGVLVKTSGGEILGAVGVSGDTSDNDEIAAIAGIEAAGFVADGG
jgi:uncharacterized protein GlcG (DUF336 family)